MSDKTLTQQKIEDTVNRGLTLGLKVTEIRVSPSALADYNRAAFAKERIFLSSLPADCLESAMVFHYTAEGPVSLKADKTLKDEEVEIITSSKGLLEDM